MTEEKWYKEGLPFKCTGCGKCCTGSPGYVWVNEEEIAQMANFLNMTIQDFGKRFLRKVDGRYSLVERRKTYDCVFLDGKQCTIYEARPTQCKTFPWWPQNLTSKQAWEETAKACEGICDKAPLVGFETIESQRLIQLQKEKKVS